MPNPREAGTSKLFLTCALHFQIVPSPREASTSKLCPAREKLTLPHYAQPLSCTSTLCSIYAALPDCAQPASCTSKLRPTYAALSNCAPPAHYSQIVPSPREAGTSKLCSARELRVHIVPNPRSACKFCPTREKRARLQIVRSPAVLSNCAQFASCASKLRTVQDIFSKTHKK